MVRAVPTARAGRKAVGGCAARPVCSMRYHRADAHGCWGLAARWLDGSRGRGDALWGTVWSEERRQIERDTNRRAASPYNALTGDERLSLLWPTSPLHRVS